MLVVWPSASTASYASESLGGFMLNSSALVTMVCLLYLKCGITLSAKSRRLRRRSSTGGPPWLLYSIR